MTLPGIDISEHQMTTPDLTGLAFVIVRASLGLQADRMYPTHVPRVRAAGAAVGAYHYNWGAIGPVAQADFFLSQAVGADFLALDVEAVEGFTPAQAQTFIARVHAAGRKIGLYHSDSGFPSVGQDWNWIAAWDGLRPTQSWAFWQWQGKPLDRDHFAGDTAAFAAFLATQKEDAPMAALKPTGTPIGTFTFTGPPHALIDTSDTTRHIRDWPGGGLTFDVYGSIDLKTRDGRPVDIEGTSPPLNNRDQVYLVDRPVFGAACYALRGDGVFTAAAADPAAIAAARQEGYDAAKVAAAKAIGSL